jgi:hypothetical protein
VTLRSLRARRQAGERGAALVELTIVATFILVPLAMGVLEFGLIFRDVLTVSSSVRAGARVGANVADSRTADLSILESVKASISSVGLDRVERVVVFHATSPDGTASELCRTATPSTELPSGAGCNVYFRDDLETLDPSAFSGVSPDGLTCATGSRDATWCPLDRKVDLTGAGPDYVGVWLHASHTWVSGLFGATGLTLTDSTVMRIEPPELQDP